MKFKIDENLPIEIAELLNENGFDAKTVIQQNMGGVNDAQLILKCKEGERILVTLDTDFANIRLYSPDESAGIIVIRTLNQAKRNVIKIFKRALDKINKEPLINHLWIIEETMVRIRGKENKS